MILIANRHSLVQNIQSARDAGVRLEQVCEIAGIDERTLQRWHAHEGLTKGDGRPQAARPLPSHALSADVRAKLVSVANDTTTDNAYAESLSRTTKYRPEFPPKVLRHWRRHVNGVRHSCIGTTYTAAFVTCHRSNVIPGKTTPFWPPAMCCTPRPSSAIRHVGNAIHVTGDP